MPSVEPNDPRLYERIKADKRLLIESTFSIIDADTQKAVPFIFREEQDNYWKARTQCDAILKSRKRGFSSLILAEFSSACILEENVNAVIVAHRDEDAKEIFRRAHWMLARLPYDVPISEAGAGHLRFSQTGSNFRVITAGAKDPGRGSDITHLHLSERAFYQHESFLAAVEGACVKNARRVIETTANGAGTPFHKHWLKTKRGDTIYKPHFFPWWQAKDYEVDVEKPLVLDDAEKELRDAYGLSDRKLAWRRLKLREMSNPDLFDQEYPHSDEVAFLVSGRMVFDWLSIQKQQNAVVPPKWQGRLKNVGQRIELVPSQQGPLKIWDNPREDRRYIISADVAEGLTEGAYSSADVLDASTWEQVAHWHGHCSPMEFADVLGDLGAYYNWGLVVPEVNNHGLATCSRLADQGYPNLYVREQKTDGVLWGWQTTAKSKIQAINELAHALKSMDVKINSQVTIEELKSFVYLETREQMGAQAGAFDDSVMSLAIGVSILNGTKESPMTRRQRFREALGLGTRRLPAIPKSGPAYGVRRAA